jgi:hypothetical protein
MNIEVVHTLSDACHQGITTLTKYVDSCSFEEPGSFELLPLVVVSPVFDDSPVDNSKSMLPDIDFDKILSDLKAIPGYNGFSGQGKLNTIPEESEFVEKYDLSTIPETITQSKVDYSDFSMLLELSGIEEQQCSPIITANQVDPGKHWINYEKLLITVGLCGTISRDKLCDRVAELFGTFSHQELSRCLSADTFSRGSKCVRPEHLRSFAQVGTKPKNSVISLTTIGEARLSALLELPLDNYESCLCDPELVIAKFWKANQNFLSEDAIDFIETHSTEPINRDLVLKQICQYRSSKRSRISRNSSR